MRRDPRTNREKLFGHRLHDLRMLLGERFKHKHSPDRRITKRFVIREDPRRDLFLDLDDVGIERQNRVHEPLKVRCLRPGPRVEEALHRVERADLLVVASPVFRGSYTGHFKHFFDLIDTPALLGKPVVLAATGGGTKHCLVVEHQLRPLFAFFRALTLPTAVYGADADFENYAIHSKFLKDRITSVAEEARRFFPVSLPIAPLERSHHHVSKNSHFDSR